MQKNSKHTEESKLKMSNFRKGKKWTEEHRKNSSESHKRFWEKIKELKEINLKNE